MLCIDAVLCALNLDRRLLSQFLKKFAGHVPFDRKRLIVVEQTFPEIPESPLDLEPKTSLPDGLIYERRRSGDTDETRNALVIESKIGSNLEVDQLYRHTNGVKSHGYSVAGLTITARGPSAQLPEHWNHVFWSDIYAWLLRQPRSVWSNELINFFEVLDAQMANDGTIGDKTLTKFNGIAYDASKPYNYGDAKRLLRLLRSKILENKTACKALKISSDELGRKSITRGSLVWDYFRLRTHTKDAEFTAYPHLTFTIGSQSA